MLTYHNRYIPYRNIVCFMVESIGIFLSVTMAYLILYSMENVRLLETGDLFFRGFVIAAFAQICMYVLDLYDINIPMTRARIVFSALFTTGFIFISIGVITYFNSDLAVAGNIYYLAGLIVFLFLVVWRVLFELYMQKYSLASNILIIGSGTIAQEIATMIADSRRLGFELAGHVGGESRVDVQSPVPAELVWDAGYMEKIIREKKIERIIVAPEERRRNIPVGVLLKFKAAGINVMEWPEFYERLSGRIPVKNLQPSYLLFHEGFQVAKLSKIGADVVSLIISAVVMLIGLPFFAFIALAIRMNSKGRIFYVQTRIGKGGKPFKLIKFRTMVEDAESNTGAVWACEDDPRVTRVGYYLRKYRIDELPQFINVLKGEMNVVGPRPERPEFVQILEKELPYYSLRHTIKPGITGWAQVKFTYTGTLEESKQKLEYDLFYIKNRSLRLDVYIILKTLKVLLLGRGSR